METKYEITFGDKKQVNARVREFIVQTDHEETDGGDNAAPTPFELFLASIGTCVGYQILAFCRERNIPTGRLRLEEKITLNDSTRMAEKIDITILLPQNFPEKYRDAVIKAGESCIVKKHIGPQTVIQINSRQRID